MCNLPTYEKLMLGKCKFVTVGVPCWHIHHDILMEFNTYPLEMRVDYIKRCKPGREIELRLQLLKPLRGPIPGIIWDDWRKLQLASKDPYRDYLKEHNQYTATLKKHKALIESLHKIECPNCPWDGETIFPKPEVLEQDDISHTTLNDFKI